MLRTSQVTGPVASSRQGASSIPRRCPFPSGASPRAAPCTATARPAASSSLDCNNPLPHTTAPVPALACLPARYGPAPHLRHVRTAAAAATAAAPSSPQADPSSSSPPPFSGHVSDEDKAIGCLIGAMCGNVLAAPYQDDRPYQVIRYRPNGVTDFWRYDIGPEAAEYGHYTGDFSLLLAVAKSVVGVGGVDGPALLGSLLQSYIDGSSSNRRFGPYDRVVLDAVLGGSEPLQLPELAERYLADSTRRHASTSSDRPEREPFGPSDYAAAARVAPVGFAYRHSGPGLLLPSVRSSLEFSHPTPLGLDAAHVVAAATAWCARQQPSDTVGCRPEALLLHLLNDVAVTQDMCDKLRLLRDSLQQLPHITSWREFYAGPHWHAVARVHALLSYHGFATAGSEAAAVALWALITSWGRPEQALAVAASFGGHAPATTQMVGAMAGALYGREWIPERWWVALENGEEGGRDAVVEVGRRLAAVRVGEQGGQEGQEVKA